MQYNFSNFKLEIKKTEEYLNKVYRELNIGRASPVILDSISIEVYGSNQPIKNVASISIEDARTLRIIPWDKSHVKVIEKAIMLADIGLSTAVDDAGIRVIFPQLTSENKQKLIKVLKEKLEEARISIRKIRQDEIDNINKEEKEGNLNQDEKNFAKDNLQKIVDEINNSLEEIFKNKEKELMN